MNDDCGRPRTSAPTETVRHRFKNNTPLSTSTSTSTFSKHPPLSTYFLDLLSLSILIFALRLSPLFAATCTFTDGAWDTTPSAGDDIVLVSGNLTWGSALPTTVGSWTQREDYTNSTVTFDTGLDTFTVTGDIDLQGGTWTHTANPSLSSSSTAWTNGRGTKQLIVSCGGDFTIGPKAKINANGCGFRNQQGPGYKGTSGGSHGGNSAQSTGKCYGSPVSPITIGSGGRDQAGGGAIRLTVSGALAIDGPISANCVASSGHWHGAGGSIYLTAGSMTGTGTVSAVFGSWNSASGGGGRIALKLTGDGDFSGLTGKIATSNGDASGGNGTIYYETKAQAGNKGKLVLDARANSFGREADIFDIGETYDFSEIVITNGGNLAIYSDASVTAQKVSGHSSALANIQMRGGTLTMPAGYEFTKTRISMSSSASRVLCGDDGDLTLGNGTVLYTSTAATELTVPGDMTVRKGAQVSSYSTATTDSGYGVRLHVLGDLTVDSGGYLTAVGLGFYGATQSTGGGTSTACGGSHGGVVKNGDATATGTTARAAACTSRRGVSSAQGRSRRTRAGRWSPGTRRRAADASRCVSRKATSRSGAAR